MSETENSGIDHCYCGRPAFAENDGESFCIPHYRHIIDGEDQ